MPRKIRATEISSFVEIPSSQYAHYDMFCVNCNGINRHYSDCKKHETYSLPPTAEAPSKQSSKRKWDIFKKQFVFAKPLGYWNGEPKSWFFKTIEEPNLIKKGLLNDYNKGFLI